MKKILCLLFCALGCLFMAFWGIAYIVFYNSNPIPNFITTVMWINAIIVVIAIVVGFGVIQISIDQWFPDGDGDVMTMKDRILIAIAVFITLICGGLFVLTILDYNLRGAPIQIFENIKLDMLMCILADTYVAFAYYQHFCVAAKQKEKNVKNSITNRTVNTDGAVFVPDNNNQTNNQPVILSGVELLLSEKRGRSARRSRRGIS